MKSVLLPPMNPTQEAKAKRLMDLIGEYMGSSISVESVISMKVNYPDDRPDVDAIIKRLAGNKTGLLHKKHNPEPVGADGIRPDPQQEASAP